MCYHPLKAFQIGFHDSGKPKYKITSYDVKSVYASIDNPDVWYTSSDLLEYNPRFYTINDFIEIPCGHCIDCRLKYSRDWANRCMLEARQHESNYFITLTYNDEHLPDPNTYIDKNTAVISDSPVHPLVKRDVQLFLKRLRSAVPDQKIRYFGSGEYSPSMRPHYHLIIFGLFLDDLELRKIENGCMYYTSSTIERCWTSACKRGVKGESLGFHIVTDVSWDTCAYTARYVTKKLGDSYDLDGYSPCLSGERANIYEDLNFPREFSVCSRRPGIGRDYYDLMKEHIYENDEIICPTRSGARSFKPPRYYDKLFDIDYPEVMSDLKEKRIEIAKVNNELRNNLTSLDYLSRLKVAEVNAKERTKVLSRKGVD